MKGHCPFCGKDIYVSQLKECSTGEEATNPGNACSECGECIPYPDYMPDEFFDWENYSEEVQYEE